MDFFARQETARAQTRWLIALFVLAVIVVDLAVTVVLVVLLAGGLGRQAALADPARWLASNAPELALCALAVLAIVLGGAAAKSLQLQGGGAVVARLMGADLVDRNTTDPAKKRLLNVVEEMALASGVPVPAVYVMEGEGGINAFAAGHTAADSVVTVTRGALDRFDRDRAPGRRRPRVQPHPERRHAAQPAAHRAGRGAVRDRDRRAPAAARRLPQPQGRRDRAGRSRHRGARLRGRDVRPHDPGGDLAPARVPGRRLGGAVHARPAGAARRAGPGGRLARRARACHADEAHEVAHMFFASGLSGAVRHPPAAGGSHPRARPVVPSPRSSSASPSACRPARRHPPRRPRTPSRARTSSTPRPASCWVPPPSPRAWGIRARPTCATPHFCAMRCPRGWRPTRPIPRPRARCWSRWSAPRPARPPSAAPKRSRARLAPTWPPRPRSGPTSTRWRRISVCRCCSSSSPRSGACRSPTARP